jgi:hypothetical protein
VHGFFLSTRANSRQRRHGTRSFEALKRASALPRSNVNKVVRRKTKMRAKPRGHRHSGESPLAGYEFKRAETHLVDDIPQRKLGWRILAGGRGGGGWGRIQRSGSNPQTTKVAAFAWKPLLAHRLGPFIFLIKRAYDGTFGRAIFCTFLQICPGAYSPLALLAEARCTCASGPNFISI